MLFQYVTFHFGRSPGLHGGYGRSRMPGTYDEGGDNGSFDIDPRGGLDGGQIGYNWQSGAWVYGVELDGTWSGMTNDRVDREQVTQEIKTTMLASLRARMGIRAGDKLIYVTGGVGYARSKLNVVDVQQGPPDSATATLSS